MSASRPVTAPDPSRVIVSPSLLAADWGRLAEELRAIEDIGAQWLHLDVMDGRFVPAISFGAEFVRHVRKHSALFLDVHLMVVEPERQIEQMAHAGADCITVHFESCANLHRSLQRIHALGKLAGVAVVPTTPIAALSEIAHAADLLLVMSINPGWGGQRYLEGATQRLRAAKALLDATGGRKFLQVDGGINPHTATEAVSAGANLLVAGTAIFGQPTYAEPFRALFPENSASTLPKKQ